jgi:hypothetical protein
MNNRNETNDLIPVKDFAASYVGWRGHPVTPQYIYKLIDLNRTKGKALTFEYVEIDKQIWIKK